MNTETQESRTVVVGAKVTPREKLAIQFVAGMMGTDVANLLRVMSIEEILAKREKLAARLDEAGAAA